jgi:hypothetical protein
MDRFVALPVKGDAFLYQRRGVSILVDGGYRATTLARQLRNFVPNKRLDVVVCTHADKDHAGGFTSLLDDWNGQVGEFWLPGRWADLIPVLTTNAGALVDSMIDQLLEFAARRSDLNHEDLEFDQVEAAIEAEASAESRRRTDPMNIENQQTNEIVQEDLQPPNGTGMDEPATRKSGRHCSTRRGGAKDVPLGQKPRLLQDPSRNSRQKSREILA